MAFLNNTGLERLWSKITSKLNGKVDKVDGKGLSTNDYTTSEKNKLAGIDTGANKTVVDSTLSSSSINPVQNKVVNTAISNLNTLVGDTAVSTQISSAISSATSSTTPKVAGTAAVGTETTFARGDHVHPAQTTVSGNAGSATKLATSRRIDGVSFNGSASITHYGTCSTGASTVEKTVSLTGFSLTTGARIIVKFNNSNTASSPTLNVNGTGAKNIRYRGINLVSGQLRANGVYEFVYDGTYYNLIGDIDSNTDTKVTNTLNTTAKAYVTGTTSASTNTGTQVFDTGVYLDTTAGYLTATMFNGDLSGTATKATQDANGNVITDTYATKTELDGKAPAGYGLGEPVDCYTFDGTIKTGFYSMMGDDCIDYPQIFPLFKFAMMRVETRWYNVIKQTISYNGFNPDNDVTYNVTAIRSSRDGGETWGELEFVNPPMELGVEYRTIERWNHKPVYTRMINVGTLPGRNQTIHVSIGNSATNVLRACGVTSEGSTIPYAYNIPLIWIASTKSLLTIGTADNEYGDYSNITGYVQVWYTKE